MWVRIYIPKERTNQHYLQLMQLFLCMPIIVMVTMTFVPPIVLMMIVVRDDTAWLEGGHGFSDLEVLIYVCPIPSLYLPNLQVCLSIQVRGLYVTDALWLTVKGNKISP